MTIEDAIKDLELIKAEAEWEYPINWQASLDMAIEALRCSEKPNSWISCSERLPEDDGWYLCTIKKDETGAITVSQIRYFEDKGWKAYGHEVMAWMNEPEPWEGGEDK